MYFNSRYYFVIVAYKSKKYSKNIKLNIILTLNTIKKLA